MNIFLISPNSPYESIGGVERYLINFIKYCETQSFETIVLVPGFGDEQTIKQGSVTIYFSKYLAQHANTSTKENAHSFAEEVKTILETHSIGVICAENFHLGVPAAFSLQLNMIAALKNIPIVLKLHSFAATELQTELVNQLMWKRISCVSKSVAGDCFRKGADINILSTDYLGVDREAFKEDTEAGAKLRQMLDLMPEHKIVLTASRIILGRKDILKQKGIINTVKAFSKLTSRYPDLRLVIAVGRPPESLKHEFDAAHKMLLGYLKLHDVAAKTIVRKFQLEEMALVYQGSDVFVLPSENETFGQVFIEAMACGLPVIGTNVGGIPEIISDKRNGYLIPPNDATVLAQRIESIINDTEVRENFIKAGKKSVTQKFDSKQQFIKYIEVLNSVADTKTS
ncbi:glycosyltransferase family 4 protein [Pedobacter sp.]|nr:glycosyltransferase family 4 protein [Candidatus Saccharibacteria bacterium]